VCRTVPPVSRWSGSAHRPIFATLLHALVTGAGHVDGAHVPNVPDNVGEGARRPSPTPTPACRRAFTRRGT